MKREPVLTWAAVAAAAQAAQAAFALPHWAHALIAVGISLTAGHQARRRSRPA